MHLPDEQKGVEPFDQIHAAHSGRTKGERGIWSPSHEAPAQLLPGQRLVTCVT